MFASFRDPRCGTKKTQNEKHEPAHGRLVSAAIGLVRHTQASHGPSISSHQTKTIVDGQLRCLFKLLAACLLQQQVQPRSTRPPQQNTGTEGNTSARPLIPHQIIWRIPGRRPLVRCKAGRVEEKPSEWSEQIALPQPRSTTKISTHFTCTLSHEDGQPWRQLFSGRAYLIHRPGVAYRDFSRGRSVCNGECYRHIGWDPRQDVQEHPAPSPASTAAGGAPRNATMAAEAPNASNENVVQQVRTTSLRKTK